MFCDNLCFTDNNVYVDVDVDSLTDVKPLLSEQTTSEGM